MTRYVLLAALVLSVGACKKKPASTEDVALTTREGASSAPVPAEVMKELAENFSKVNFAFDAWTLDEASQARLANNAKLLKAWPSIVVEVQGHADDRGTTDYNLALGEKRASTVRRYLVSAGVEGGRLTTVSYGEERPAVPGESETAWSENRRAEFRILSGTGVVGTAP